MSSQITDKSKSNGSNTALYILNSNGNEIAEQHLNDLAEFCVKSNNPFKLYCSKTLNSKVLNELSQSNKIETIENNPLDDEIKNVIPLELPLKNSSSDIIKWAAKANKVYDGKHAVVANGKNNEKSSYSQKYYSYFSNFWYKLLTGIDSNMSQCELILLPIQLFNNIVLDNKIQNIVSIAAIADKEQLIKNATYEYSKEQFSFGDGFKSLIYSKLKGFKSNFEYFFKFSNQSVSHYQGININAPIFKKTFVILASVLLFWMVFSSKDYNVTWDEPAHNNFSKHAIKFYTSFGSDTSMFEPKNSNFGILTYGSSVDLVIRAVNDIFGLENEYYARHLIDALIGFLLVLFTALTVRRLTGWLPAILTIIALFGSPSLYGHFFNNSKDVPFATGYIMAIYYLIKTLQELPKVKHQTKVMLAISLGFGLSVRVGGILTFAFFAMFLGLHWLFIQNRKKAGFIESITPKLKLFFLVALVAYFIGIFFWPYALRQPFTGVITALKQFEKFGLLTYYELFEGVRLYEKPWYYIPKMILITAPIALILGFGISLILAWIKKDKLGLLIVFLLIFVSVFPLAYAIYKKSYVYNGWRHFLFIYPSLVVLAMIGWNNLAQIVKNKFVYIGVWSIFGLLLLKPIFWNIKNHPYQYMYFNEIVGGIQGAQGNYDIDYWNQTPRAAFEWLVKNKPELLELNADGKSKLKVNANSNAEALKTFVPEGKNVQCLWTREMEWTNNNWDYAIWSTRTLSKDQILDGYWPPKGTIHTINVDGVPVTAIVKAEHQHSYWGNYYLRKNNADSALFFYLKAYEYNPLEEEYARGVANAYKTKMNLDSAILFYKKAIQLKFGNYEALQSLGEIYYTKALMKDQNNPDAKLLEMAYIELGNAFKNKKNASAPLLMGEIDLLRNKTIEARDNFYKFLETYGNVGRGYLGLGKAQLKNNETDSALMNFQYCLQLEPNNAEAYYYVGTELEKMGRKKEAEQYLNQYLKLIGR